MSHELPAERWPLIVQALRLEGSAPALETAQELESWLREVQHSRARFSEALARLAASDADWTDEVIEGTGWMCTGCAMPAEGPGVSDCCGCPVVPVDD